MLMYEYHLHKTFYLKLNENGMDRPSGAFYRAKYLYSCRPRLSTENLFNLFFDDETFLTFLFF